MKTNTNENIRAVIIVVLIALILPLISEGMGLLVSASGKFRHDVVYSGVSTWSHFGGDPDAQPDEIELASTALVTHENQGEAYLPTSWDNRLAGRTSPIRTQGDLSTCWAFATLGALESYLMPEVEEEFSVDHLTHFSGYGSLADEGGSISMSLAYLLSWRGPVSEAEDPYNDGEYNENATVLYHLQEAQLLDDDREAVKLAVLLSGAVQSSMYADEGLLVTDESTAYYNDTANAYYYNGSEKANHDVLIVGWDDDYPASNFESRPAGDGAFLCQNSWGEQFGDEGFFYVSYYDSQIISTAICFSRLEETDNYDTIYQYDALGWVAQMGFNEVSAWGANVFTAGSDELLRAVGFYAVEDDVDYEVYLATNPDTDSFTERTMVAAGHLDNPGYYTIDLDSAYALEAGESFGVIIKLTTQEKSNQLPAESKLRDLEPEVNAGESYISADGENWHDAGETLGCNLCLKAYVDKQ